MLSFCQDLLITFTFYGPTDYNHFQGPCFYLVLLQWLWMIHCFKKMYLSYSRSWYDSTFKPAFFWLDAVHKQNDLKSWRVGFVCSRQVQWTEAEVNIRKRNKPIKKKFCTISNMIKKKLRNVVLSVWFIFKFWIFRAYQWNWNCSFFPHQESQPSRNNGPKMCFYLMLMFYYICYHRPICFNRFMIHYSLPVHLCA